MWPIFRQIFAICNAFLGQRELISRNFSIAKNGEYSLKLNVTKSNSNIYVKTTFTNQSRQTLQVYIVQVLRFDFEMRVTYVIVYLRTYIIKPIRAITIIQCSVESLS